MYYEQRVFRSVVSLYYEPSDKYSWEQARRNKKHHNIVPRYDLNLRVHSMSKRGQFGFSRGNVNLSKTKWKKKNTLKVRFATDILIWHNTSVESKHHRVIHFYVSSLLILFNATRAPQRMTVMQMKTNPYSMIMKWHTSQRFFDRTEEEFLWLH